MESGKNTVGPDFVVLRSNRRRGLRRQALVQKVTGEDSKGVFFGYATSIGRGGMFITSVNPKKTGEEFTLSFEITELDLRVKCRCVVAWHKEYNQKLRREPGMGIRFLDLDDATKEAINNWANTKG